MDERLEQALDISNLMVTMNNQKRLLKEQYQENLIYYFNGGQFTVTQQLISFCQSLLAMEQTRTVLTDDNDMPVEIEDLQTFSTEIISNYYEASNAYLTEYNKLKTNRSIKGIMDL
jgi:tRNA splicing endonuclease